MVSSIHRQHRCQAILLALPTDGSGKPGQTTEALLEILGAQYADCASQKAQRRAIQRDLQDLCNDGAAVSERPSGEGTTLRYWRTASAPPSLKKAHLADLYTDLVARGIPPDLAAEVVRRVQHPASFFDLPATQFIAVPDSVRLSPLRPPDEAIKGEILIALREKRVLKASYQKLEESEPSERRLHLVGIVQRGAQHYVIGYDERDLATDERPVKMYLLSRFADALALEDRASLPSGPSLAELALTKGIADFQRDPKPVRVQIKVRGYVRRLLSDTCLSQDQTVKATRDPDCAIVTATLPLSGTLYRWLLGFGDKVEVLTPKSLRRVVASQAKAVTAHYDDIYAEIAE